MNIDFRRLLLVEVNPLIIYQKALYITLRARIIQAELRAVFDWQYLRQGNFMPFRLRFVLETGSEFRISGANTDFVPLGR